MKNKFKYVYFILPAFIWSAFFYFKFFLPATHDYLLQENGPIEWAQVLVLLLGVNQIISSYLTKKSSFIMSSIAALFLAVCALEELDWMQKIYFYPTPAYLITINDQHAVNFHNIRFFHHLSRIVMVSIALWTVIAPYIQKRLNWTSKAPLTPSIFDLLYSVSIISYFFYCYFLVDSKKDCMVKATSAYRPCLVTWNQQEICELFVYVILWVSAARFSKRKENLPASDTTA
jgi:hypothetical protein